MSNEKLSDRDLTYLRDLDRRANDGECDTDDLLNALPEVVRLVDELRAHRSRELSAEDVEALRDLKDWIRYRVEDRICAGAERRSLPVLVRILEASK